MPQLSLYLSEYVGTTKILAGRTEGEKLRKRLKLNSLDKKQDIDIIIIVIPDDLFGIAPSFFLGLFGQSIHSLGDANFKQRYIFECQPILYERIQTFISYASSSVFFKNL
ncbi:MAG: hypothetical protein WAX04_06315 [Oscillospiraceae bacterium]